MIKFEWDSTKAASNQKKHGITFNEAKSIFYDELAVQFYDKNDSKSEDRFLMLGLSCESRVFIVCHCERHPGYPELYPLAKRQRMSVPITKVAYHESRI